MSNHLQRGRWMAFAAAMLGWMFDGFEMGLFPQVAQPALKELIPHATEADIGNVMGAMTAIFLVGAATGGVVFGWLGDRLGRVRAMSLSILAYALFSGLCGVVTAPWQLFVLRFLASLGMGGEWSLGVSLVMEIWPNQSRGWLAGLIGAASNVGFMLVALVGLTFVSWVGSIKTMLLAVGINQQFVDHLMANGAWRLLALSAAMPAILTFLVRVFVPESERWVEEHSKGTTKQWSSWDLLSVVFGATCAIAFVSLWAQDTLLGIPMTMPIRIVGTVIGLICVYWGYTYPIRQFLHRSDVLAAAAGSSQSAIPVSRNMVLGATLSGIALLGTWASIQNAPPWAGSLAGPAETARLTREQPQMDPVAVKAATQTAAARARAFTQIASAVGAIVGTIVAAFLGNWLGRRNCYCLLCILALATSLLFFRTNTQYGPYFLATVFAAGCMTASFYGWLPLYLPELFPTRVRAFGQGFAFNFGRIIAAVGSLQFSFLMKSVFNGSYAQTCTVLSFVYLLGIVFIWMAPETNGQELPE